MRFTPSCWVVTDGKAGMENQCLGLAEAAGLAPTAKRIALRFPWNHLPPQLWIEPFRALAPGSDRLDPPWPDILIATGRQTVALSLAIRRASGGRAFTVQIQNPTVDPRRFDLVVTPAHDRLTGENVIVTRGALHRVNPTVLARAKARFENRLAALPRPLVVGVIGGSNRAYRFTAAIAVRIARNLKAMIEQTGGGLAVTLSRRTDPEAAQALRSALAGIPAVIWDGEGENPYFGFLALADAIVVTVDSVSMISEACSTGKPVYLAELEGGSAKFERFHQSLIEEGLVRRLSGSFERWSYPPLRETEAVAAELLARFRAGRGSEKV